MSDSIKYGKDVEHAEFLHFSGATTCCKTLENNLALSYNVHLLPWKTYYFPRINIMYISLKTLENNLALYCELKHAHTLQPSNSPSRCKS